MLEEERQYYNENREAWATRYPGQFVLVKGRKLIGAYDTMEAALAEGARLFGLNSFLIRRASEVEQENHVTRPTLFVQAAPTANGGQR